MRFYMLGEIFRTEYPGMMGKIMTYEEWKNSYVGKNITKRTGSFSEYFEDALRHFWIVEIL